MTTGENTNTQTPTVIHVLLIKATDFPKPTVCVVNGLGYRDPDQVWFHAGLVFLTARVLPLLWLLPATVGLFMAPFRLTISADPIQK